MDKQTQEQVQRLYDIEVGNAIEVGKQLAYIRSKHPEIILEAARVTQTNINAHTAHQLAAMRESNSLPPEVSDLLARRQTIAKPIDVVEKLWKFQTDIPLLLEPQKRVFLIQDSINNFLKDIGLDIILPTHYRAYLQDFGNMSESIPLMRYFHSYYPLWLKIAYAIQDGYVVDEVSYHVWQSKGCPVKFRWSRVLEKITRRMPPIVRENWHLDPENCLDILALPQPQEG